jgi:hypothetical protein
VKIAFRTCLSMFALASSAMLAGCASTVDFRQQATENLEVVKKGPAAPPFRTITGFADGLRCMDNQMIIYGVRELPMLVEDLGDQTKKLSAGTRDMLISAVSDMSKRSRGIRLVTFGADVSNLANFHANAESKRPYQNIPLHDIRGSISQLDEAVFKKQADGGITIGPIGIGAAKSADATVLALDLSVISAVNYAVIPGVTARNSVMVYKEGAGVDGEAEYKKLGLNFGMTLTRSEGRSQALRTLIELSVIELIGKLTHTPYWSCLGADLQGPEVTTEISDWFYSMAVNGELMPWMQEQLALRGAYSGPIDGEAHPEFDQALIQFRVKLGLSAQPKLDEALFAAYLRRPHQELVAIAPRQKPVAETAATPSPAPTPAAAPVAKAEAMTITVASPRPMFRAGETINLTVVPSHDAHVFCYLQDEAGKVVRFFPNRFVPESLVRASSPLQLPGDMRFALTTGARGTSESVDCFAVSKGAVDQMPAAIVGTDFEPLPVSSLHDVRSAVTKALRGNVAVGSLRAVSR